MLAYINIYIILLITAFFRYGISYGTLSLNDNYLKLLKTNTTTRWYDNVCLVSDANHRFSIDCACACLVWQHGSASRETKTI